ncbi:hypothetical protein CQ018_00930 [Arthrobacter sp. MYb227]|uniref:Rv3235 family protein n=1 Tax=Arthrobacter sp. MYb227 TaxID=1848601 RepID=UPI000CFD4907|nr:Rv3235 family protein [Arthrobacter sp. MYb227]PQZ95894.1 hypothetical protein CQ018_00930 [Arthrobacter sp. MYb227]
MSITILEPLTANGPQLMLHEDVWVEDAVIPVPSPAGKRFPENLHTAPTSRGRRCVIEPPVVTESIRSPRWNIEEPNVDQFEIPEAVRPIIEKIFPRPESIQNLAESVGTAVHAVAPALLEVLAGARPARQLAGVLNPDCMGKLEYHVQIGESQQPDRNVCCYSNPRVLRIRVSQVLPMVFEAAVILLDIKKVRATALRIELWHGRWQVTALEIG